MARSKRRATKLNTKTTSSARDNNTRTTSWIFIIALAVIGLAIWQYTGFNIAPTEAGLETKTVFVSTLGKDTNNGDYSKPLRSIRKAVSLAQDNQRLQVSLVGPTYSLPTSDIGIEIVINPGKNIVITGNLGSSNNPVLVKTDSTGDSRLLSINNRGEDLEISNLKFQDIYPTLDIFGTLNFNHNTLEITKQYDTGSSQSNLEVLCWFGANCQVRYNKVYLHRPGRIPGDVGVAGIGAAVVQDSTNLYIKDNIFYFPNINNDWPVNRVYRGIQMRRVDGAVGNIYLGGNSFITQQYSGLKNFIGEVGIYLKGPDNGINIGKNNFSKFSGIPLVKE